MVEKVLTLSTEESDNPDLRDRGYIYWRLLSTDPEAAKAVILSEKPMITSDVAQIDKPLLATLMRNISMLASVYMKPPESFVPNYKTFEGEADDEEEREDGGEKQSGDEHLMGTLLCADTLRIIQTLFQRRAESQQHQQHLGRPPWT